MQVLQPVAARIASSFNVARSPFRARHSAAVVLEQRITVACCGFCTASRLPIAASASSSYRTYSAKVMSDGAQQREYEEHGNVDLFGDDSGSQENGQKVSISQDDVTWEEGLDGSSISGARPPTSTTSTSKYDVLDPRPKLPGSIKRLNRILSRQRKIEIPDSELDEKFVKGRGPGGQAINKTNSSVSLTHIPTGIRVQAQPTRSREENRKAARRILAERLEVLRTTGQLSGSEMIQGIEVQFPQHQHQQESADRTDQNPVPLPGISHGKENSKPKEGGTGKGKGKKAAQKEEEKSLSTAYTKAEIRAEKERRRKANRAKKAKKKYGKKGESEGEGEGEDDVESVVDQGGAMVGGVNLRDAVEVQVNGEVGEQRSVRTTQAFDI
ncbi:hypothetical protein I316_05297 [Kwoniella heveanensis BCC8398]|uniref:Prokaryotic-type class I peptide chain release factors domain-containing protein n=1 Tax=Kwoniella heveanensis BCC8398 TaxID=1296120 RepID=A0A1B9GPE3_9TREE|nr:hypothetical protein I316_05297 [Kwoniella heveanensis BCC8398]